jgi:hypothetical protein
MSKRHWLLQGMTPPLVTGMADDPEDLIVDLGYLRCVALLVGPEERKLNFDFWVARYAKESETERLMVPSPELQQRLLDREFPVQFVCENPPYSHLTCTISPCPCRGLLRWQLQQIARERNWQSLFVDPEPGEWERWMRPSSASPAS